MIEVVILVNECVSGHGKKNLNIDDIYNSVHFLLPTSNSVFSVNATVIECLGFPSRSGFRKSPSLSGRLSIQTHLRLFHFFKLHFGLSKILFSMSTDIAQ